jgi:hypothetical protein
MEVVDARGSITDQQRPCAASSQHLNVNQVETTDDEFV